MDLERTISMLESRHFSVSHFATGTEAAEYLATEVKNTEVGIGGCMTAEEIGLFDKLEAAGNTVYWHWRQSEADVRTKENNAPVYICSANALTEDGQILNIDGSGNRFAGLSYGPGKTVYLIISVHKICSDFASALDRARNVAAVTNAKRFENKKIPCRLDGRCHDCRSQDRICNGLQVLWGPMIGMKKVEVVLIDEKLGY